MLFYQQCTQEMCKQMEKLFTLWPQWVPSFSPHWSKNASQRPSPNVLVHGRWATVEQGTVCHGKVQWDFGPNTTTVAMKAWQEPWTSWQIGALHHFHYGGRSMGPGDNCMETRSQRPQSVVFVYCSMVPSVTGLQSNSSLRSWLGRCRTQSTWLQSPNHKPV